jgi:phosphoesterase RecJ-like protein
VDGLSAFPRRIEGVEVGLTLREISNGEFKVSARSNGFIDVSQICVKYGGGGHKRAAGCIIKGDIYEIEKNLVTDIESAFEGVNA